VTDPTAHEPDSNRKTAWGSGGEPDLKTRNGHSAYTPNEDPTPVTVDPRSVQTSPWLAAHPTPDTMPTPPPNPFLETAPAHISGAADNASATARKQPSAQLGTDLVHTPDQLHDMFTVVEPGNRSPVTGHETGSSDRAGSESAPGPYAGSSDDARIPAVASATGIQAHSATTVHTSSDDDLTNLFADNQPGGASVQPGWPQNTSHIPGTGHEIGYNDPDTKKLLERYRGLVNEIRLLGGQSGDPQIQKTIIAFELTSDKDRDQQQLAAYRAMIRNQIGRRVTMPNPQHFDLITQAAYDELLGLGPLGPLWRDDTIADIMVTGPNRVDVERDGKLIATDVCFDNLAHLQSIARTLSAKVDDRTASRSNPLVTAQLPGSGRIQIVWEPNSQAGCDIVIRKHRALLTLHQLLDNNSLTPEIAALIADAVTARASILVAGGTGSGKTTWLNIASGFIPDSERVVVLEDTRELALANTHVSYLLTKTAATIDDVIVVDLNRLLEAALRMRPDRIIVGEVITKTGAAAVLEAAYTGHDGTMTTIHASDARNALIRMARLLSAASAMTQDAAQEQVWDTFDIVLYVERDGITGRRYIKEIGIPEITSDGTLSMQQLMSAHRNGHTIEFSPVAVPGPHTRLATRMTESSERNTHT